MERDEEDGLGAAQASPPVESMQRAWLNAISRYRLLSSQEQYACYVALQRGDKRSPVCTCCSSPAEALVQHNYRLITDVADKYRHNNTSLDREDLWQYGVPGLMKAVERWEPERGAFSTVAYWWIRQAITRAMIDFGYTIREPVHTVANRNAAKRRGEYYPPRVYPESLDKSIGQGGGKHGVIAGLTLADIIPDPGPPLDEHMSAQEMREALLKAILQRCTKREAAIIVLRFGLDSASGAGMTLQAIGDELGVSRERVRQVEMHALSKLAGYLHLDASGVLRKRADVVRLHQHPRTVSVSAYQASKKPRPAHSASEVTTLADARESQPVSSLQRQTRKRAPSRVSSAVEVTVMSATTDDTDATIVASVSAGKGSTKRTNASSQGKQPA